MHSISLELMPYFYLNVFYTSNNGLINILKCDINGLRLTLSHEQNQSVIDEINEILRYN